MNNYQWIWNYVKKNKKKVISATLILLANSFFVVIIPILSGRLIDEVIENNRVQLLVPILLAMIGATLIRTVTRYIYQMFYEHVGQGTTEDEMAG